MVGLTRGAGGLAGVAAALAAAVACVGDAGATTDPVAPVAGAAPTAPKTLSWSLVGVSRDGRALLVRPGSYGGCDTGPPAVAVTATATTVALSVTVQSPTDPAVVCPQIAVLPPIQSVALSAPIAGRRVTGPQRTTSPGAAYRDTLDRSARVPRVIGLRAADARSVLCAWGLRPRPGAGAGTVAAQTPRPGTALTAPTTAPPTSCAAIRATVTLHTR